jgi:hypothetical protein
VEILTVEEFLEFILPILNFFKFVSIKLKFALEKAMNSQRGRKCTALLFFFNLGARCGWILNATFWQLYPRKTDLVPIVQEAVCPSGPF